MSPLLGNSSLQEDGHGHGYSFAVEYTGPPVVCDLPRAVPINLERIPVAPVLAAQVSVNSKLSLPVVQPLLPGGNKLSKDEVTGPQSMVSPTSVIDNGRECAVKDGDLGSDSTVSLNSVVALEVGDGNVKLSGKLSCSRQLGFAKGDNNGRSGELSDAINKFSGLSESLRFSEENSRELFRVEGNCSSNNLMAFSDSFDRSWGSSRIYGASNGQVDSVDFNVSSRRDWTSKESALSLECLSSRRTDIDSNEINHGGDTQNLAVEFHDIESHDGVLEDEHEQELFKFTQHPWSKGKKGSCYKCFKGHRFTEKEVCIVCDAKYCSSCVLKAMGSMPEGRKCVACIGSPIDESKRAKLGKCSRMLKRLLNDLEVKQIMKAEKLCLVNQLSPDYVCVNGKPLCYDELIILQNCLVPPKKLKPGYYWYDKVSGLWGKEGQKPCQIISAHLNVGGPIRPNASNGNTQVFINGREITKVEVRMLQLAGVQCAGNPHFWVNDDGSYQEEGQKNTKGYIWGKAGTKLLCALLSLPVPSKSSTPAGESSCNVYNRIVPDYVEHELLQKILLVGYGGSGSSTIFKQAKLLYRDVPFSMDERECAKLTIQANLYRYLGILLEGRERFEDECLPRIHDNADGTNDEKTVYSIGPRLKAFSDWFLKTMALGNLEDVFPTSTREYAPLAEELWSDPAIQATYKRRNEIDTLPSIASYFLERAVDVLQVQYVPSDLDIMNAEDIISSNGLACMEFSFPQFETDNNSDSTDQHESFLRYQLIRVHAKGLGENCRWLEMFEDIGLVAFCVSLSDYDQYSDDGNGSSINKMLLSRRLFESIVKHPAFEKTEFLLLLNKFDLFEDKIERVPLNRCEWFDDFRPILSHSSRTSGRSNSINYNPTLGHLGFHYIAVKFKRFYTSLTGRTLYVSLVKGFDQGSVDSALKYGREILKWQDERMKYGWSEYSMYSTEPSL
ncbi:hypothetical protein MLD38_004622 [Melastoma candidum]|uniref:Uncharacterized protein n=1 Tax=Melastoma candidum TaxID=119954 RepID=A0ACB9S6E1_9MYRT|nr:hypothetical protein MLD38_004622 [Melastoma candidum]